MNEREHCFCKLNHEGKPVCCQCGAILKKLDENAETFAMWERLGHERRELDAIGKEKQGRLI